MPEIMGEWNESEEQKKVASFWEELTPDTRTVMTKRSPVFFQEKEGLPPQVTGPHIFPEQGPA